MTMEMKDKFVMAANRGYDVPVLERSNSGVALGSITMGSAGRGRKEARSESVTRLQDAVRKKRKDSRGERGGGGAGSDSGWGSNGGEIDLLNPGGNSININSAAAAMGMSSPPPRPPSRPHSRTGRPPHHGHGGHPGAGASVGGRTHSIAAVAGDNSGSGSGSGGDEGPDLKFFGGYHTVASPYHPGPQGGYVSPASVALEGRLNMLSQRVDDLAQAHMRQVTAAAAAAAGGGGGGGGSSVSADTVVQTQMLLSAKLDAIAAASVAKSSGEGRMQLLLAAAGGAAAAMLAVRLADLFSSSSSSGR